MLTERQQDILYQDQIKQFESLAKPLMEWLKEHRASGTVLMTSENCQFLKSEITIERQFNFYDDPDNYVDELVLKNVSTEKQNPVNYEQAASTPVPTEVDESHTKYLAEWEAGEWLQHETRPLSITTWYACWLHAKETGVPMYVDNSAEEVKA